MDKIPMTSAGYTALEVELKRRQQQERPRIIQAIAEARSHGDLSENAEYHAAKESQSLNEGRIADLEDKATELRGKIIALKQSTVVGERFVASVRVAMMRDFDLDKLRKRVTEDQLDRCRVAIEHIAVTVHERDGDE